MTIEQLIKEAVDNKYKRVCVHLPYTEGPGYFIQVYEKRLVYDPKRQKEYLSTLSVGFMTSH